MSFVWASRVRITSGRLVNRFDEDRGRVVLICRSLFELESFSFHSLACWIQSDTLGSIWCFDCFQYVITILLVFELTHTTDTVSCYFTQTPDMNS